MVKKKKNLKKKITLVAMAVFAAIIVVTIVLNRVFLRDFFRGLAYRPTSEMAVLKSSLDLTDGGKIIFDSSWPELNDRDAFNEKCRTVEATTAILGCYTDEIIYVYNIEDKKLDGIREATLAHELLHAVYARMSDAERKSLKPYLDEVYNKNKDALGDELKIYSESEQYEELYVRAGTEIKKLPAELERHFEKYFKNQDLIADYYNKYASVFKKLEKRINELKSEIDQKSAAIEAKKSEYEQRLANLNAEIMVFNSCANTPNCFNSEWEFYVQRNALMAEKNALIDLYDELNDMITDHNAIVNEYNNNVINAQSLNNIINSTSTPSEIK